MRDREHRAVDGGSCSAPANGGTSARTPGKEAAERTSAGDAVACPYSASQPLLRASRRRAPEARVRSTRRRSDDRARTCAARRRRCRSTSRGRRQNALPCPRAARKLPNATTVSAGNGREDVLDRRDAAPCARYSAAGGSAPSQSSRSRSSLRSALSTRTSEATAMQASPSPRPIQPMPSFVFPFTLTSSARDAERVGERVAHRGAVRRDLRRLGDRR